MRIAIASEETHVCEHFGHCEGFTIYDKEECKSLDKSFVPNPGHRPGYLPVFLKDLKVNLIIAGGMGETAQQLFNEYGIEVVVGVQGFCDDVIKKYIKDELKSSGSVFIKHERNCNE